MRALQGRSGAFSFSVSEFLRVSGTALPEKVFHREVPELLTGGLTVTGMPVQVQLLGGDAELMAESARNAVAAGAKAIDINFGCPAPTVNRHDGGASILRFPERIREIVSAVKEALEPQIPVSAKLRLGWEQPDEVHRTAKMAALGGADWLVIHARTKLQKYAPPVHWKYIRQVREDLKIPVVANGDIWSIDDFRRCREETGCLHYMLGRGALADPGLAARIALELGLKQELPLPQIDWSALLKELSQHSKNQIGTRTEKTLHRLKQWLNMASRFGDFPHFDKVKTCKTEESFFQQLSML